jgi:hypothetical protein
LYLEEEKKRERKKKTNLGVHAGLGAVGLGDEGPVGDNTGNAGISGALVADDEVLNGGGVEESEAIGERISCLRTKIKTLSTPKKKIEEERT